jgi:hypothetical protein
MANFNKFVRELRPGESAAAVEYLPDGARLAEIRAAKIRTHSRVTVAANSARRALGLPRGSHAHTSGDYRALDGRIVVVATVTLIDSTDARINDNA